MNNVINNEYITNNIQTLETWSGHQVNTVLYDSDIDGKDSQIFRNKTMNHQHLYFIVIDSDNNVFDIIIMVLLIKNPVLVMMMEYFYSH